MFVPLFEGVALAKLLVLKCSCLRGHNRQVRCGVEFVNKPIRQKRNPEPELFNGQNMLVVINRRPDRDGSGPNVGNLWANRSRTDEILNSDPTPKSPVARPEQRTI